MPLAVLALCATQVACAGASVWSSFKPDSGTAIVGRVLDPKGAPVQSVQVSTNPETDTEFTNEEGYFSIQVRRTLGGKGQASTTAPIPPGTYEVLADKSLYRPHEPVAVKFRKGVQQIPDLVLVPEPIDLDITGFRPAKSDPTLPVDSADPKRE